jgi:hypothetical protein
LLDIVHIFRFGHRSRCWCDLRIRVYDDGLHCTSAHFGVESSFLCWDNYLVFGIFVFVVGIVIGVGMGRIAVRIGIQVDHSLLLLLLLLLLPFALALALDLDLVMTDPFWRPAPVP